MASEMFLGRNAVPVIVFLITVTYSAAWGVLWGLPRMVRGWIDRNGTSWLHPFLGLTLVGSVYLAQQGV